MMAGQVLADRYELGERLGIGGMSTVVRAFDDRLERDVAIKLLAEHLADDSQFVARFRREALAVARLVHPNIVQVFDFGLDEATHRQYIVMELVRGQSGAEILREEGVLEVRDALSIVAQACRGLEYAHRNGVVHRDVKPGNLLRGEDGVVKLADFGIAKAFSDESSITQVGSVLGTAAYLAPEQAAGEPAGTAADLYALGVVTYQLLSGRLPYEAQSLTELALKQQREVPPRLDELNPDVSPQLAMAVDRALAPAPGERRRPAQPAGRRRARDRSRVRRPDHEPGCRPADERHERRRAAHGRHGRRARSRPAAPAQAAAHAAACSDLRHAGAGRDAPTPARRRQALPRGHARAAAARGRRCRRGSGDVELRPGGRAAAGRLRRRPAGRRCGQGPRRGQHEVAALTAPRPRATPQPRRPAWPSRSPRAGGA
jgi:eukaryotic-like serine/threonine-protein kinase